MTSCLRTLTRTLAMLALAAGTVISLMNFLPSARGCGLDWVLPRNHFEGVTNQGHVSYWEKIGEVDCGDGLVLPLHINFSSRRDGGAPSPYLGRGWLLALLESKFVQEGEDRFNMIQPDGLNNLFLRAEKGGSVLNGSSGWKGEIKGDTISAWASCGWKLVFTNGRIASMTTAKGRKLDWIYEGGKVSELREGNATRLKVEYGADGRMQALALPGGGERILVAQDKKPRVQTVAGQNVVAGVDNSLSRLVLADGREQEFTYGTDEKTRPTLEVGAVEYSPRIAALDNAFGRQVVWDPQSKLVVRAGEWNYQITPAKNASSNAAIGRTNTQKQHEYWFRDDADGEETVLTSLGDRMTTKWFTSGNLSGKLRSIRLVNNQGNSIIYKADYNEHAQMIREQKKDRITTYKYSASGSMSETYEGSTLLTRTQFDNLGRIIRQDVPEKETREMVYYNDGSSREIVETVDSKTILRYSPTKQITEYASNSKSK